MGPLAYLLDENVQGWFWAACQRHNARGHYPVDVMRVGDSSSLPLGSSDAEVLLWAEGEGRILVSFDKASLPQHLADHLASGHHSPGLFLVRRSASVAGLLSFLTAAAYASEPDEWQDRVHFIP